MTGPPGLGVSGRAPRATLGPGHLQPRLVGLSPLPVLLPLSFRSPWKAPSPNSEILAWGLLLEGPVTASDDSPPPPVYEMDRRALQRAVSMEGMGMGWHAVRLTDELFRLTWGAQASRRDNTEGCTTPRSRGVLGLLHGAEGETALETICSPPAPSHRPSHQRSSVLRSVLVTRTPLTLRSRVGALAVVSDEPG